MALWTRATTAAPPPPASSSTTVTVQLPLRNEGAMAEAQLRGAALDIHVLDDSDDETSAILERTVSALRTAGHDIALLRRPDRRGCKAGYLAYGHLHARGECVLVLYADFRPHPDLAVQLVHILDQDATLPFAQARWSFRQREHDAHAAAGLGPRRALLRRAGRAVRRGSAAPVQRLGGCGDAPPSAEPGAGKDEDQSAIEPLVSEFSSL